MIIEKSGLVDDSRLMFDYYEENVFNNQPPTSPDSTSLLATLIKHFRVLRLAYERKLRGEVDRYKRFVYPKKIDKVLYEKDGELHKQLIEIKATSSHRKYLEDV